METLAKLIGNRIREIRKEKGLRQEDMEDFGLSYRYYQNIETGKANVTLNTIEKIARALEIEVEALFFFPLDRSKEANELVALINQLIRKKDMKSIRKLNLIIREIL